jgi:hypothetical protein
VQALALGYSLRNVRALLVYRYHHRAILSVKANRWVRIADFGDGFSGYRGNIDVCLSRNFAGDYDQARGYERFTSYPPAGVFGHYRIQHRIGYLVGDFVRVPHCHGLTCEKMASVGADSANVISYSCSISRCYSSKA